MTGTVPVPPGSRVVLVPTGVDAARIATRLLVALPKDHRRLVVRGSVLRTRTQTLAPSNARRQVGSYLECCNWLWSRMIGGELELLDRFTPDFRQFMRRAANRTEPLDLAATQLVVLEAQLLHPDFYWLLRMAGVSVTALIRADAARSGETTWKDLCTALGCEPVRVKEPSATTVEIHTLVEAFAGATTALAEAPARRGPRPVLRSHRAPEAEIDSVARLAESYPDDRIGVFLPDAESVRAFRDRLSASGLERVQWYLSAEEMPPPKDWKQPGITLLTWSSAVGTEFDTVALPGLELVGGAAPSHRLHNALLALAPLARRQLILSYSGLGRPEALNALPPGPLDDQTGKEPTRPAPSARTILPDIAAIPVFTVPEMPSESKRAVTEADVAAALAVLDFDRSKPVQEQQRRTLTASEEAGLARLMRGVDLPLDDALTIEFRRSMKPGERQERAFQAFVVHNLRLVAKIAGKYKHNTEHLGEDDLRQIGVTGLIRAVEMFDASRGLKFSTYATWWIRQSVTRGIADLDRMVRLPVHIHEKVQKIRTVQSRLDNSGMPPTIASIASACKMTTDEVRKYLRWSVGMLSLDSALAESDDFSLADLLPTGADLSGTVHTAAERRRAAAIVGPRLDRLTLREREMIELRYGFVDGEPKTLEQIGSQDGVTRERVRQILNKALQKLAEGGERPATETVGTKPVGRPASRKPRVRLTNGLVLPRHPRSQDLGTEPLESETGTVAITPHVLPHPESLDDRDLLEIGDPSEWRSRQGFYLCCRDLPPIHARWLNLPGLDESAETALARVIVELEPETMALWGVHSEQISPHAPDPLRERLIALAELARERSRQVVSAHGSAA